MPSQLVVCPRDKVVDGPGEEGCPVKESNGLGKKGGRGQVGMVHGWGKGVWVVHGQGRWVNLPLTFPQTMNC